MVTVEAPLAEAFAFGELSIPREFVILRDSKEYILSDGLLVGLVQLSRGFYDIETAIVQLPTPENAQTAVVTARVSIFDPESGRVLRTASGTGDASPGNVGRMVAPHVLRMAETRGVARALRHLLGVGLTALEELGQGGAEPGQDAPPPAASQKEPVRPSWGQRAGAAQEAPSGAAPRPVAAPETVQVDGRTFTREQVMPVFLERLEAAHRAELQVAPMGTPGGPPPPGAPLRQLVDFSAELKRRLEAKAGAARASASGK